MDRPQQVSPIAVMNRAAIDTYDEIATKAQRVREIFASREITIRNGSALSQLLRQADVLSREWSAGREPDIRVLAEAAHVNRLADSIISLPDETGIQEALRRMAGSVMQPDDRKASQGKDALWEVALLADLKKAGLLAQAAEPDILVNLGTSDYPIACKKIWSERGLGKHIDKGAKQLEPFGNGGVIALNLDDLTPAGHVFIEQDSAGAKQFLDAFNIEFVGRHWNLLQTAVMEGKCDGILLSTTALCILSNANIAFNLITQTSLWHLREAAPEALDRFLGFANAHSAATRA
ncbi:hypothetical protein ACFELC_23690 [Pseudomonas aeruginosa]|uniref:hypothetical protein n=1 Tax=Pseudomonas aeruginosa TaxID=287 RepID=UPI00383B0FD8